MEITKLLKNISENGTGILKGVYRSDYSLDDVSPELPHLHVKFSIDGVNLGKHTLLIEKFPLRLNGISCTMCNEDGSPYEPLPGFGDKVFVTLIPFPFDQLGDSGEFIAFYPQIKD